MQSDAENFVLHERVNLIAHLERMLPRWVLRRLYIPGVVLFPNKKKFWDSKSEMYDVDDYESIIHNGYLILVMDDVDEWLCMSKEELTTSSYGEKKMDPVLLLRY